MWQVKGIHHVAFAHDGSSDVEAEFERALGLGCEHEATGEGFLERVFPVGGASIQTLQPRGPGSVERFVARRGSAVHHLALEVEGLDEALEDLRTKGVPLTDETARPGGMGTRIAFLHPSAFGGLLIELVEVQTASSQGINEPQEKP
jgi:methylmalonyl-CoA/ethylmalonyl-CoA epimerase